MFRSSLELLYEKHYERIAQVYDDPQGAFDILAQHNLDVDSIDKACCNELKEVLSKTHDFQVSDRLNKYGWTSKHISDHMSRFFESKMKAAARLLTLILKDGPDADLKRALCGYEPRNALSHDSDSDDDAKYAIIGRHNIGRKAQADFAMADNADPRHAERHVDMHADRANRQANRQADFVTNFEDDLEL